MKIPDSVLREAWLAGTREVQKRYMRNHGLASRPKHWRTPEQLWEDEGEKYLASIRAAVRVIEKWRKRRRVK